MTSIQLKEPNVKKAISDYLTYQQNLGNLVYFRLNAGSFILTDKEGNFRRRVQGVQAGTADFLVIRKREIKIPISGWTTEATFEYTQNTFLESKGSKGKTSKAQDEFAEKVKALGCQYFVVRSVEEAMGELK